MIFTWSGWIAHLPSKPILRGVLGVLAALVEIAELQGHVVDAVDAGGARRDDRLHLRVVVDLELLFGQLLGADVAGEVGDAEDEPGHARRRGRDLVGLQARLGRLDEHLELDAPDLEAHVLLDLRQQAIGEAHVVRPVALGQHHDVDVRARRLDDLDDVLVEELGADVVRAERANLALEVERVERLDERLARLDLLRDRARVLEIEDHLVGLGAGGLGHHLQRMRRAGELGAADAEVASDDQLIVVRHLGHFLRNVERAGDFDDLLFDLAVLLRQLVGEQRVAVLGIRRRRGAVLHADQAERDLARRRRRATFDAA